MSGIRSITRRSTIVGSAVAGSAPIYVDSDDNKVKLIPAGSGTTEVALADSVNGLIANAGSHLILATTLLSKQVKLNSITDSTTTSGDLIGFQSNPGAGASGSQSIYGFQVSPRVNSGVALSGGGSVIGGHISPYLKGTAAGTIAGDVRGLQIENVTDDAGTRTISGDVVGLRFRTAFSGTITGKMIAIQINKPETQTNSKTYSFVLDLPSSIPLVWNSTPGTEPSTPDGYFAVRVNGATRYVQLYSGAPTD
jgi:hypothetical protein